MASSKVFLILGNVLGLLGSGILWLVVETGNKILTDMNLPLSEFSWWSLRALMAICIVVGVTWVITFVRREFELALQLITIALIVALILLVGATVSQIGMVKAVL